MDDGKEVSVRVGDGSIHCRGMTQRDTIISLPRGWVAFLSSFYQQILTVPGTGMTEIIQICPCTQGTHRWMRGSLVSVVTGCCDKQFHFRLKKVHAHHWVGQSKWFLCGFSNCSDEYTWNDSLWFSSLWVRFILSLICSDYL